MNRKEKSNKISNRRRVIITVATILVFIVVALGTYINIFFNHISDRDTAELLEPQEEASDKISEAKENNKINILVIGESGGLSDTLLLCNYDIKTNNVNLLSIPRDTYYPRQGYNHPAQKKINAAFGSSGAKGSVKSVEGLTGLAIDYYVTINYKAVERIVDALGGIEFKIPYNMNYDDPADNLHIHFEKNKVVEKGSDIVKVIRWRKNNNGNGGYTEGDMGRINTQHEIIKLGIEKILGGNIALNIIKLQKPIMDNVKTDMPPDKIIYYLSTLSNVKEENITVQTLPGVAKNMEGLSFFVADEKKMTEITSNFTNTGVVSSNSK